METFEYYKNKKCKNLLIHSDDVVLVNKVIECSENHIIIDAEINEDTTFLDTYNNSKVFRSYKCIEMMAQSLGCFQYINMSTQGSSKAKIGFLLGARKFDIYIPFIELNKKILIETKLSIQNDEGFGVYDSIVYDEYISDTTKIASATLSVLSPSDDFIKQIQYNIEGI